MAEVHVACLPPSCGALTNLEYRAYEGAMTHGILRAVHAAAAEGFDALIVGCFYDTALLDAREVSGAMHVVAPCMAACEIVASLCNRFGVITGRSKWAHQMRRTLEDYGCGARLTGLYDVGLRVDEFQTDPEQTGALLLAAAHRAVTEDQAEALILGCTMETGFHNKIEDALGVPVIDPVIAAFHRADYAARLKLACGLVPSRKWSCEAPPAAELDQSGIFAGAAFGARIMANRRMVA
jgi:allantoin racemase